MILYIITLTMFYKLERLVELHYHIISVISVCYNNNIKEMIL